MYLPRYKCHKEVQAFKIRSITIGEEGQTALLWMGGRGGYKVEQSLEYFAKHRPKVGGYYVLYDDGYESYSPATAFEAGYTLIE